MPVLLLVFGVGGMFGNFIGVDVSGMAGLANGTGITVDHAQTTTIGKPGTGLGNVISANSNDGIDITDLAFATLLQNDFIGVGSDGTKALGNTLTGVVIETGASSLVVVTNGIPSAATAVTVN